MLILFSMACQTPSKPESVPLVEQDFISQTEVDTVVEKGVLQRKKGQVFFFRKDCVKDCVVSVNRTVERWTPEVALDLLYQGPTAKEEGFQLLNCKTTGAIIKGINEVPHGFLAEVHLVGGCGDCGTQTIADLIEPTLLQFEGINIVHLYDPQGRSQIDNDTPFINSRPACLEP